MRIEEAIRQSRFESPYQKVVINVTFTANKIRSRQAALFKPFGISPQHYNVLRILRGSHPKPKAPSDIKAVMLDKSPDLTRIIDKLVKNGWVTRKMCAENRRKVDTHITKKGLALLAEIDPLVNEHMSSFQGLTEAEAHLLSDLLDKLRGEDNP